MCEEIFSLINKVTEKPKINVDRFLLFCSMVTKISANGLHIEEKLDYLISRMFNNADAKSLQFLKSKFEEFIKANDFSPNKLKDFLQSIKNNEGLPSPAENYEVDILCFFAQMRAKQIFTENVKSYKKILKKVCVEASDAKANNEQKELQMDLSNIKQVNPKEIFADYVVELAKILDDKFEFDKNSTKKSNDSEILKTGSEPSCKSPQQTKENNNLLQDSNFDLEHILNQKFKLADTSNLTPDEQFLNFILNTDLTQESITSDPYNVILALKIPENLAPETVLKIYVHVLKRFRLFDDIKPLYWKIQKCCDKLLSLFSLEFNSLDELLEADKKLDKHYKRIYYQHLKNIFISYLAKKQIDLDVFLSHTNRLYDQGYDAVIYKGLINYNFDDVLRFFCDNSDCVEPIFNYVNDHICEFAIAPGFEDDFDYKHEKHETIVARTRLLMHSLRESEKGSAKRKKLNYLISCLMLGLESDSNTFQTDIDMFIDLFELENSFLKYCKPFAGVKSEQDVTDKLKQKLNRWVKEFCNQVEFFPELPWQLEICTKILKCSVISKDVKSKTVKILAAKVLGLIDQLEPHLVINFFAEIFKCPEILQIVDEITLSVWSNQICVLSDQKIISTGLAINFFNIVLDCPNVSQNIKAELKSKLNCLCEIESQVLNQKQISNFNEISAQNSEHDNIFQAYANELDSRLQNYQSLFKSRHCSESTKKKIIENLAHEKEMLETYYKQQIENIQTDELLVQNNLTEEDLKKEYCKDYIKKNLAPQYERYKLGKRMSFLEWLNGLNDGGNRLTAFLLTLVMFTGVGFVAFYLVYKFIWKPWAKRKCQEIDKYFDVLKVKDIIEDRKEANEENFIVCRDKLDKLINLCTTPEEIAQPKSEIVESKDIKESKVVEENANQTDQSISEQNKRKDETFIKDKNSRNIKEIIDKPKIKSTIVENRNIKESKVVEENANQTDQSISEQNKRKDETFIKDKNSRNIKEIIDKPKIKSEIVESKDIKESKVVEENANQKDQNILEQNQGEDQTFINDKNSRDIKEIVDKPKINAEIHQKIKRFSITFMFSSKSNNSEPITVKMDFDESTRKILPNNKYFDIMTNHLKKWKDVVLLMWNKYLKDKIKSYNYDEKAIDGAGDYCILFLFLEIVSPGWRVSNTHWYPGNDSSRRWYEEEDIKAYSDRFGHYSNKFGNDNNFSYLDNLFKYEMKSLNEIIVPNDLPSEIAEQLHKLESFCQCRIVTLNTTNINPNNQIQTANINANDSLNPMNLKSEDREIVKTPKKIKKKPKELTGIKTKANLKSGIISTNQTNENPNKNNSTQVKDNKSDALENNRKPEILERLRNSEILVQKVLKLEEKIPKQQPEELDKPQNQTKTQNK